MTIKEIRESLKVARKSGGWRGFLLIACIIYIAALIDSSSIVFGEKE